MPSSCSNSNNITLKPSIWLVAVLVISIVILLPLRTSANENSPQTIETVAEKFAQHNRLNRTIKFLESSRSEWANSSLAPLLLGYSYYELGQYEKAVVAFESSKRFAFVPNACIDTEHKFHYLIGFCHYQLRNYQQAVVELQLTGKLSQAENLLECAKRAALATSDQSNKTKTVILPDISCDVDSAHQAQNTASATNKSLNLQPRHSDNLSLHNTNFMTPQEQEELASLEGTPDLPTLMEVDATREFPGKGSESAWRAARGLMEQAEYLEQNDKFQEAEEKYSQAIRTYPFDASIYANLANCEITMLPNPETGDFGKIYSLLEKAVAIDSTDWRLWNNLGVAHIMSGKALDEGLASLRKSLSCKPPDWARIGIVQALRMQPGLAKLKLQLMLEEGFK